MRILRDFHNGMSQTPTWVVVWVNAILGPVVMAPFVLIFFNQHPVIISGLIGSIVGVSPNFLILHKQRGVSKALSFPHLAWIPFVGYHIYWLAYGASGTPLRDGLPFYYVLAAITILGISLAFDIVDAAKWLAGDREILRGTPTT